MREADIIENMAHVTRLFKRYRRRSPLSLARDDLALSAETLDYSLEGVCIELAGAAPIGPGDTVRLDVSIPRMKGNGRVVWARQAGGGLRLGIRRLGLLYGFVGDFDLADVLVGLQRSLKSGVLHVVSGGAQKLVCMEGGHIVFAASNRQAERLGDVLVRKGRITQIVYDQAVDNMNKSGKRLGRVLVDMGLFTEDDIRAEVEGQVGEIVLGLIGMPRGEFMLKEGSPPARKDVALRLSAADLIYRGVKGIGDIARISGFLPPEGAVLKHSDSAAELIKYLSPDEADRRILSMVDGRATVRQLIAKSGSGVDALKGLCAFILVGMLDVLDAPAART